ncbi:MAG: serine/threonine protein kinase [Phycisphaerales bacterium]|nr:serine/threonine protein kinase [Phycisphaerales bacterium]
MFMEVADLPEADRDHVLARECGGDATLRAEVDALLRADRAAGGFMGSPTADVGGDAAVPGDATTAPILPEQPGARIGPYKLLQLIGEGGFGSVFMAEQERPVSRKVAIKIIKLGMDTRQVIARFEAERQALAMMDHSNIAQVLDAGATETGRPFFVMELVKGDPIVEYCDKNNLSINDRLELFAHVCNAVQHAHTKGIIHRDIKPSNILVTTQDGRPHTKVIDFGIAKATASKLTEKTLFTEHKALIGTPEYMSPEQAEGSLDIDTRTDVYSLGVLLYELLTGTTPFSSKELRGAAYAEIQRIIREVEPPRPSTRLGQSADTIASVAAKRHTEPKKLGTIIRGELDWIVMKALEKDRVRRYDSAGALAMDLRRHLRGEPVHAAPPSKTYRVRKFLRRHRGAVLLANVIVGALLVSLVGVGAGFVRSERALQREAIQRRAAEASATDAALKAARAARLSEFLGNMFTALDPNQPTGREVSVRSILDAASKRLDEGQLRDDPVIEADVRFRLGTIYYTSLHDWYSAEREYSRAVRIREGTLGPSHRQTLMALHNLGIVLQYQGRFAEAEATARRTLERRSTEFGEEDPDTISSMEKVSWALSSMGRLEEAEPLRVRALELRRRVQGEDHPDTIEAINYLGNLYLLQGNLAKAEPLYREELERTRRVYGAKSNQVAGVLVSELTSCLLSAGEFDEAIASCQEAVLIRRAAYGDRHRVVARSLARLGAACTAAGRYEEAERALTDALDMQREFAPGEDEVAWTLFDLGRLKASQDRLADAEAFMREGLEIRRQIAAAHGKRGDPWSLRELAAVLGAQGRQKEANELVREADAIESKTDARK